MNLTLPSSAFTPSDPTNTFTFNGHTFRPHHLNHPLLNHARTSPSTIDTLLRRSPNGHPPPLLSPTLPAELESSIKEYVSTLTTPGFYGDGRRSRPRWFYANCAIFGMLLGRAFALLSTPTRPPKTLHDIVDFPFMKLPAELRLYIYEYYKENLAQRRRYWDVMTRIFVKALWSACEAEQGACYMTSVILLSCGHAMSLVTPMLRGSGSCYIWWDDTIKDVDVHTWSFADLCSAIFSTRDLPRDHTDASLYTAHLDGTLEGGEYVSKEVLEVYDLAREHLRAGERDWTPPEIEARLMRGLFANEEARGVWERTGQVPWVFEEEYVRERDGARRVG